MTPEKLLKQMQVGERPIYILGSFDRRVTVYAQQVRALNLIYSLEEQERIKKGDHIGIVGGGVAGVTAAAGAAQRGMKVTLLEKNAQLLHQFSGCDKRWLHPRIYDWPDPASMDAEAKLPVMNWSADTAKEVVKNLRTAWEEYKDRVRVETKVDVDPPDLESTSEVLLSWTPGLDDETYRAVIFSVGFGWERGFGDLKPTSYWRDDDLAQGDADNTTVLISGVGDGGLTDVMRACLTEFEHETFLHQLGLDMLDAEPVKTVTRILLGIEERVRKASGHQKYQLLYEAYFKNNALDAASADLDARLHNLRRKDRKVVLNGPDRHPMSPTASVLNRYVVSRLVKAQIVDYKGGKLDSQRSPKSETGKVTVWLENKRSVTANRVIIRHGTESALKKDFPDLCAAAKGLWHMAELDLTRHRMWTNDWFGGTAVVRVIPVGVDPPSEIPSPVIEQGASWSSAERKRIDEAMAELAQEGRAQIRKALNALDDMGSSSSTTAHEMAQTVVDRLLTHDLVSFVDALCNARRTLSREDGRRLVDFGQRLLPLMFGIHRLALQMTANRQIGELGWVNVSANTLAVVEMELACLRERPAQLVRVMREDEKRPRIHGEGLIPMPLRKGLDTQGHQRAADISKWVEQQMDRFESGAAKRLEVEVSEGKIAGTLRGRTRRRARENLGAFYIVFNVGQASDEELAALQDAMEAKKYRVDIVRTEPNLGTEALEYELLELFDELLEEAQ